VCPSLAHSLVPPTKKNVKFEFLGQSQCLTSQSQCLTGQSQSLTSQDQSQNSHEEQFQSRR
jgi:hypothetical protein